MSRPPPAKPWERGGAGSAASPGSPFAPSSGAAASTSEVVAAAGTAGDTEVRGDGEAAILGRAMPSRPWESGTTSAVTPYNQSTMGLGGSGYSTMGSSYLGANRFGSGGMYGTGSSMYGGYGSSSMYGSGLYGSRYGLGGAYGGGYGMGGYGMGGYGSYGGNGMGGYGMGGYGGYGGMGMGMGMMGAMGDPNDPNFQGEMAPPRAPSFWISSLKVIHGVMTAFGRLSILVDENTHAFHFFITALLQLFDRAGVLYGEIARFVLRLLGFRSRQVAAKKAAQKKGVAGAHTRASPADGIPVAGAMAPAAASASRQLMGPGSRMAGGADGAMGWDNLWSG